MRAHTYSCKHVVRGKAYPAMRAINTVSLLICCCCLVWHTLSSWRRMLGLCYGVVMVVSAALVCVPQQPDGCLCMVAQVLRAGQGQGIFFA